MPRGAADQALDQALVVGELHDDGTNGDTTANDGVIDAVVGNPFQATVPGDTALTLQFVPHAEPYCDGTPIEVPYTTGATYSVTP